MTERDTLDDVADAYVRLVLAVQRHNPNYLDAYFGPPEWRAEARRGRPRPVADLLALAQRLLEKVRAFPVSVRRDFLERQLVAVDCLHVVPRPRAKPHRNQPGSPAPPSRIARCDRPRSLSGASHLPFGARAPPGPGSRVEGTRNLPAHVAAVPNLRGGRVYGP